MTSSVMVLAAGASTRMGTPKQLLKWNNETLLNRMIRLSIASSFEQTMVILGANRTVIEPSLNPGNYEIAINEDWEKGMSASIRVGLSQLLKKYSALQVVLIVLVDQPYVDQDLIQQFYQTYTEKKTPVIASAYANTLGVPALFDQSLFPLLLAENQKGGAKRIIQQHKDQLIKINFPEGANDLDTPESWVAFSNKHS
ncbi:MAG: nucleotidyltransferase family protein [Bacteroidota bacterium]